MSLLLVMTDLTTASSLFKLLDILLEDYFLKKYSLCHVSHGDESPILTFSRGALKQYNFHLLAFCSYIFLVMAQYSRHKFLLLSVGYFFEAIDGVCHQNDKILPMFF